MEPAQPSLLARASFWTPWLAAGLLGVLRHSQEGTQAAPALAWGAGAALLGGVALAGVALRQSQRGQPGRREALLGLGSGGLLGGVMLVALWTGHHESGLKAEHDAHLKVLGQRAVADAGGWLGRAQGAGFAVFISEISPASDAGSSFIANFPRPFQLLLVAVDNRASGAPLTLDLSAAQALRKDGAARPALSRQALLTTAKSAQAELTQQHLEPYMIPPGGRLGNGMLFLDAAEDLRQVTALRVRVNGQDLLVNGRYLSAEEKRARRRPAPGPGAPPPGGVY